MTLVEKASGFFQFIRFSHTVFAMPFALGALVVASNGLPSARLLGLVIFAMVFARTAAMTFNRLADWEIDLRNPRTNNRHRLASRGTAIAVCVVSSIAFVATCSFINPLCFYLSPVALAAVFFYSFTKRFTHLAQFFLGFALAVAPVGAWLAVTGSFALAPILLAAGVVCWVAGFDMIYATQDYEVDRREGLRSMVVWLGVPRALQVAQMLHAAMWLLLIAFGISAGLGVVYFLGAAAMVGFLLFEHRVARRGDVQAINAAFFTSNAWIGALFVASTWIDRLV
jgi:4-hydroxybenzoate polyprenyltransferase